MFYILLFLFRSHYKGPLSCVVLWKICELFSCLNNPCKGMVIALYSKCVIVFYLNMYLELFVQYKCSLSDCMPFLHVYTSPNIKVIQTRKMCWAGHVGCTKEMRNMYRILVTNPWETNYKLETITLNDVFKNRAWICGLNALGCDGVHRCLPWMK